MTKVNEELVKELSDDELDQVTGGVSVEDTHKYHVNDTLRLAYNEKYNIDILIYRILPDDTVGHMYEVFIIRQSINNTAEFEVLSREPMSEAAIDEAYRKAGKSMSLR